MEKNLFSQENEGNSERKEQQKKQVEASINFARYLITRYPQVDRGEVPTLPAEPQLNYYLAGSLATTLLSRAETIELCEETTGSDIRVTRSVLNPETTRTVLAEFARPIGDIDYVATHHYK